MIKTLTKHGNSYALIIDRPIMDLLKITPETQLDISTDGKGLTVIPTATSSASDDDGRFDEALGWTNQRYAKTFTRLAN